MIAVALLLLSVAMVAAGVAVFGWAVVAVPVAALLLAGYLFRLVEIGRDRHGR